MNPINLKQTLIQELKNDLSYEEMQALLETPIKPEEIDKLEARFIKEAKRNKILAICSGIYVIAMLGICAYFIDNAIVRGLIVFAAAIFAVLSVRNSSTTFTQSSSKHLFVVKILKQINKSEPEQ